MSIPSLSLSDIMCAPLGVIAVESELILDKALNEVVNSVEVLLFAAIVLFTQSLEA